DTGGHTGAAPTNLHQTPLPRNLPRFCPPANYSPAYISCVCPAASTSPTTSIRNDGRFAATPK
ncbi:hypothetical protein, partial [Segatella oulorum]|uniref:hypothetical protein n=1 Tax=Segatella oulorum TaxID=28136 RepID=UPI0028F07440